MFSVADVVVRVLLVAFFAFVAYLLIKSRLRARRSDKDNQPDIGARPPVFLGVPGGLEA